MSKLRFLLVSIISSSVFILLSSCGGEPPSIANVKIKPNPPISFQYYVNNNGSWIDHYWFTLEFSNGGNSSAFVQFSYFYLVADERVSLSSTVVSVTIPQNDSSWTFPPEHYLEIDSFSKIEGRLINVADISISYTIYNVNPR